MRTAVTVMLFAALFSVLATIVWLMVRGSRSKVTFSFVGCQLSQLLWVISQLALLIAETEEQFLISYDIGNLGISFLGSCWLLFAVSYMDMELSRAFTAGTLTFSAVIFICAFTNPLHGLYYTYFSMDKVTHGIMFYVSQTYIYCTMIAGIFLVCRKCFESKQRSRGQAVLLTLATGIPLIINLLTLSGITDPRLPLAPISLSVSGILVLFATYRFGFLNVNEVAFEDAFNTIEEGVVIFNRRGRITYLNGTARKRLGISERTDINSFMNYLSELSGKNIGDGFDYTEAEKDGTVFGIKHYSCRDRRGVTVAQLVIISDISDYYKLMEKTDRLAIERERNRIAQEVHDTAGHTFTMISSLAKLSRVRLSDMPDTAARKELLDFTDETESLARGGLTQLRCSINNLRDDSFMTTVSAAVKTVTDAVRDIDIEVCIQGEEDGRYSFCVRNVYSSFRELITNSVRYSGADRIDVIVKFLENSLELYVFDNGAGCKEITAHNGLKGISERTEALGGTAVFRSGEGIGFTAIIKIPVREEQEEIR